MWLLLMGFQLMARYISSRQLLLSYFNSLLPALPALVTEIVAEIVTAVIVRAPVIKTIIIKTIKIKTLAVA